MAVQCQFEAVWLRKPCSAVPTHVGDVADDVAPGSGDLLPYSSFGVLSPLLPLLPLLSRFGCVVDGHRGGGGQRGER